MNTTIQKQKKGSIKPADLPDWLLSHGLRVITTEECAHLIGVPQIEVPQRLVRLRKKGKLISPARGLWIVVSPQYLEMGAPEPIEYIHQLMTYYGCEYCVGWLSAASLSGASHQAPQVFQVAVDKPLREKTIGRSTLQFYYRSYVSEISKNRLVLTNGSAFTSTPGATMLMVSADVGICAGIDNAATIISEMAQEHDDYMKDVVSNMMLFPVSAVCRLGWILDHVADSDGLEKLEEYCRAISSPAILAPGSNRSGKIDKRWNIIENRIVEADI